MKIFLTLMILTTINCLEVKITSLEQSPGMIPFKIGKSRMILNEHTFVHYIPLDLIRSEISKLHEIYTQLNNFSFENKTTEQLQFSNAFLNSHEYLGPMLQTIVDKFANIDQSPHDSQNYSHPKNIRRQRRGLFNFIGKVNKWATGTLDNEDGERYDQAIEILRHNQYDMTYKYGKLVALSKHLTNNYRKTIETISKNQNEIKTYINSLDDRLKELDDALYVYFTYSTTLDKLRITANMILSLLNNLENVITFSKMHLLHPDIMNINDLKTTLEILKEQVHEGGVLPISYPAWYDIIKTHSYYKNSRLIIAMDLPIVSAKTYELYHIYPVPTPNNTILIPPKPLLALHEKYYQYMDTPCEQIEGINICMQERLMYDPERECIPSLLLGLNANCNPIPIHQPTQIIESINKEYTIFYTKNATRLRTTCDGEPRARIIQGPVLVQTPLNCSISFQDFNFTHLQSDFKGHPFLLPKLDIRISEKQKRESHPKLHIENVPLDDIHEIYKQANALKPIQLESITTSAPFDWTLVIVVLIIILLICRYIGLNCFKAYKRRTTAPTVQVKLEVPKGPPSSQTTPSDSSPTTALASSSIHPKLPF